MRLDKALVHAGQGSRSEMRGAVRAGRVTADGMVVTDPARAVFPEQGQTICLDGTDIGWKPFYTLMMHKPAGVVSSTSEPGLVTVVDLLPPVWKRRGLFPVGRLDRDTTGLLLLTTDGALSHSLMSPERDVGKRYFVTVETPLRAEMADAFARGVTLGDGTVCRPAGLEIVSPTEAVVTLREGKYHQVKRMMAACGCPVIALHRQSVGALPLDPELVPGGFRELSEAELASLTNSYQISE